MCEGIGPCRNPERFIINMRIDFGGVEMVVAKHLLYGSHIHSVLQHQRRRGVTKLVGGILGRIKTSCGKVLFHERMHHGLADPRIA